MPGRDDLARRPHNTPLWFAWDGSVLWLYSIVRSQRWTDLQRDPGCRSSSMPARSTSNSAGSRSRGRAEVVGDVPHTGDVHIAELDAPELLFARKYMGGDRMFNDGRHAWLKVVPEKISSWDFRKSFG